MDDKSFTEILADLRDVSNKRDPRAVRLAAVASALVEVIGEQEVSCSAAKVYAKAVTALEGTLQGKSETPLAETFATQIALMELLQVTVPRVTPKAILAATLPLTSRVLRAIVASCQAIASGIVIEKKGELGGANAVLRWSCRVSTEVLKGLDSSASTPTPTDEKAVKQLFHGTLLTLFQDRRPKVRKTAHGCTIELLRMEDPGRCHPVIRKSANSFAHIELAKAHRDLANESLGELLHQFSFLEEAILHLDFSKLGADMMELLAVLARVDESSAASDFVAVTKVKENTPKILSVTSVLSVVSIMLRATSLEKKEKLDAFAPRVLASLIKISPSLIFRSGMAEIDILQRGRTVYGETVIAACERVVESNPEMACKLLPLAIEVLLLLSKPSNEEPEDASVAQGLMVELTQFFRARLPRMIDTDPTDLEDCLSNVLKNMQKVMEPIYQKSWSVSLKAVVVLLQIIHQREQIRKCVNSLLELRNQVPVGSLSQHAVEDAFSTLVQGMGIEACWNMIEWQPQSAGRECRAGISIDRAWVLHALKEAALIAQPCPPRLSFFEDEILGVARACDKLAATSRTKTSFHRARVVDLWSLFPCFCIGPSDMKDAVPSLATTLCRAVEDKRYPQLVPVVCGGIVNLSRTVEEEQAIDKGDAQGDFEAMSSASQKLLPVLFKLISSQPSKVSDVDRMQVDQKTPAASTQISDSAQSLQSILAAITALAVFAPKLFLQSVFKKLMHRLLEEVQSGPSDSERICSLLSLAQAIVASSALDESNVSFLYRALKPLIRNDEHGARVQKRAYKVLAEICERYHSFIVELDRLKEVTSLLASTIMTSQVSARHMRLKCMGIIVEGFDEVGTEHLDEIFDASAEILLCLKDSNTKTREAANQLIMSLASKGNILELVKVIIAALGAETTHMRSAAVMALSRIIFEFARESEELRTYLPSLLRTVLVMIDENSREVIKSVLGFIRISVAVIPPEQLEPLLPELVGSIMKYHKVKDRFRSKIKIILKKLVKLFGYNAILPHVPESESRLLTHIRKLDQRQKRRKDAQRAERLKLDSDAFHGMLSSDEEDSDDGRTLISAVTGLSRQSGPLVDSKSTRSKGSIAHLGVTQAQSKKTARTTTSTTDLTVRLPNEADGEVVDMLGAKVARRVMFSEDQVNDSDSDGGMMEFDDEGRLIVHDVLDSEAIKTSGSVNEDLIGVNAKRRRISKLEREETRQHQSGCQKTKTKQVRELGASYKAKKAGGDVKKKGQQYEPYAYVPLDGRSYSKKNRRSAVEQMSSVVRQGGKRKRS